MTLRIENASRRGFLQNAAGLTLALYLPGAAKAAAAAPGTASAASFEPNAFLRIGADNTVTVISKHLEMGQGTYTGLATIVAEELDAAWPQVRIEGAPADARRYNNVQWGPVQGTGGSTAMANSWDQLRQAGASARAMLVAAAAQQWQAPAGEITVSDGVVTHDAVAAQSHLRPAGAGGGAAAGAGQCPAQGPQGFQAGRQARAAQGQRRQDPRPGPLYAGRAPARHADGRGGASAPLWRQSEVV
jgi:isoquinoline 1-oxidoreductase subunit beta